MVKKITWILFIVFSFTSVYAQNGYKISIDVSGAKGKVLRLSYYTGTYSYATVVDSASITSDKQLVNFATKLKKQGGIYKLNFKGEEKTNFTNIVVDNGATLNFVVASGSLNTITSSSAINNSFFDYQKNTTLRDAKETKLLAIQKQYPSSVLTLFAQLELKKITPLEASKSAYAKYLTGVNLNDGRMRLLPNAYSFLLGYINSNKIDSVNYSYAVDVLLKGMNCENANYFFYLDWFFQNMKYYQRYRLEDTYQSVYQKYLNTTACKTKKVKFYEAITSEVKKLNDLEIGTHIPNFNMQDSTGVALNIGDAYSKNKYTLLVFYDPDCDHCQKMIPEVANYLKNKESQGVVIQKIAFDIVGEAGKWKNFIKEAKIDDWLNVISYKNDKKFQMDLKVFSTPTYFLLDKEGTILLKTYNTKEMDALFKTGN